MTFSPLRTRIRSRCSRKPLIGSRCTCLGRARCCLPSTVSVSRAFTPPCLSASIVSWPGRVMWTGSLAVAVEDGGHLVGATDPTGSALAELGAGLGLDVALGHGRLLNSLLVPSAVVRSSAADRGESRSGHGRAAGRDGSASSQPSHRVDHGARSVLPRRGNCASLAAPAAPGESGRTSRALLRRGRRTGLVTEPSSNTSRIARLISGAIDRQVSLSNCRSAGNRQRVGDDDLRARGSSSAGPRPGRRGSRAWRR